MRRLHRTPCRFSGPLLTALRVEARVARDAHDRFRAGSDGGLLEDGLEVCLHGVLAHPERARDIAVAETLGEEQRDLALPQREAHVVAGPRLTHGASEVSDDDFLLDREQPDPLYQRFGRHRLREEPFGARGLRRRETLGRERPGVDGDRMDVRVAGEARDAIETEARMTVR